MFWQQILTGLGLLLFFVYLLFYITKETNKSKRRRHRPTNTGFEEIGNAGCEMFVLWLVIAIIALAIIIVSRVGCHFMNS